jgi:hypothetical protein
VPPPLLVLGPHSSARLSDAIHRPQSNRLWTRYTILLVAFKKK